MNPKIQLAYNVLWCAHPVLLLCAVAIMFRRKLHRSFPVFFAYAVSQILAFSVLFPAYKWGSAQYFYAYWICAALSLAIGFKVIHEIFVDIFRSYHTLKDLGSVLFKWATLVMLLVAGVVMAASPRATDPLVQAVLTVQRCVRVIQCGLVLFLVVFSKYLGVSWRQRSFGIAVGFGGYAFIELGASALYSGSQISQTTLSLANMIAYNFAIFTWLGYIAAKAPAKHVAGTLLMSQRWDRSLGDLQEPTGGNSLIPMFEGMVEQAFSRTNAVEAQRPELEAIASGKKPPERIPGLAARQFASKT